MTRTPQANRPPPGWAVRSVRTLLVGGFAISVAAMVAVWWNTVTVLGFGPAIAAVAVLTAIAAVLGRYRAAAPIVVAQLGICGLFVGLVNGLDWSPEQARRPFNLLAPAYVAAVAWPTWRAFRRPPTRHVPGVCDGCGYALRGLPAPRCPECGLAFDPAEAVGG